MEKAVVKNEQVKGKIETFRVSYKFNAFEF